MLSKPQLTHNYINSHFQSQILINPIINKLGIYNSTTKFHKNITINSKIQQKNSNNNIPTKKVQKTKYNAKQKAKNEKSYLLIQLIKLALFLAMIKTKQEQIHIIIIHTKKKVKLRREEKELRRRD
jgi:hypothetical protein